MPESPDHEFSARLRKTADKLEEAAMNELELLVEGLASCTDRNDPTATMSTVISSPDPVINFAGGMVDGAIENLDDARDLLYQAAEVTQDGLVRLWADRMVGTDQNEEESKS